MPTIWESTDAAASTGTAYSLVPGNQFGGNVSVGGDRDWVKAVVSAGYGYAFSIVGDDSRGAKLNYPAIQLRNADGTLNGSTDDFVGLNTLTAGTYYLDAGAQYASYTGNYLITSVREVAANIASKASVAVNASYKGTIDYGGDHDWLKVQLTAGNAYVFRVVSNDSSGAGVYSPRIQLRNPDGTTNGSADDAFGFTAAASGGHFLDVSGYYSSSTYTGNYRVEVLEEVAAATTTKAVIAPNGTYRGSLDYEGDHDWVKVSLVAGQTYVFRIGSDDAAGDPVSYPYLQVRNADARPTGAGPTSSSSRPRNRASIISMPTPVAGTRETI